MCFPRLLNKMGLVYSQWPRRGFSGGGCLGALGSPSATHSSMLPPSPSLWVPKSTELELLADMAVLGAGTIFTVCEKSTCKHTMGYSRSRCLSLSLSLSIYMYTHALQYFTLLCPALLCHAILHYTTLFMHYYTVL